MWLDDPSVRSLEALRLENERYSLLATHSEDEMIHAEPFDAVELELGLPWADVEPEAPEP